MGGMVSLVRGLFSGKQEFKMVMNGLDNAGKTTILYKLKLGEVVTTIPTIGFNVETVEYNNSAITVWDVGGRDKTRPLWRHYLEGCNAIIWVIDSTDRDRLDTSDIWHHGNTRDELHRTLAQDEMQHVVLLVFANKQDLPKAMTTAEITERLGLDKLRKNQWMIQGCCATTGDGLYEGLDWLTNAVKRQKAPPAKPKKKEEPVVPPRARHVPQLRSTAVMEAISWDDPRAQELVTTSAARPAKPSNVTGELPAPKLLTPGPISA